MKLQLVLAITMLALGSRAALAENFEWQSTGAQGATGSENMPTSDVTMTVNNVAPMKNGAPDPYYISPPSNTTTQRTMQQTYQAITNTVPTTSGMPYPGTYIAPTNIAARQWGGVLPVTNLDSFVAQSGYSFDIYGDEGTSGPPPLANFEYENTIGAGINGSQDAGTLETGHGSVMPSAWLDTWQVEYAP